MSCQGRGRAGLGSSLRALHPSPHHLHGYPPSFPQQLPRTEAHSCAHTSQAPGAGPGQLAWAGWGLGAVATATSAIPGACHLVILAGRDVPAFLRAGPGPAPATPGAAPAPGPAREIGAQPGESPPVQGCRAAERQEPRPAPTPDAAPRILLQILCVSPSSCVKSSPLCAGVRRSGLGR